MEKTLEQGYIGFPNAQNGPEGVSDGTDTQVETWMINKWKAKIVENELYKGRDIPWKVIGNMRKETLSNIELDL